MIGYNELRELSGAQGLSLNEKWGFCCPLRVTLEDFFSAFLLLIVLMTVVIVWWQQQTFCVTSKARHFTQISLIILITFWRGHYCYSHCTGIGTAQRSLREMKGLAPWLKWWLRKKKPGRCGFKTPLVNHYGTPFHPETSCDYGCTGPAGGSSGPETWSSGLDYSPVTGFLVALRQTPTSQVIGVNSLCRSES